jgi:hypothetical protein
MQSLSLSLHAILVIILAYMQSLSLSLLICNPCSSLSQFLSKRHVRPTPRLISKPSPIYAPFIPSKKGPLCQKLGVKTGVLIAYQFGRLKKQHRFGAKEMAYYSVVFKNAKGFLIFLTNWLSD